MSFVFCAEKVDEFAKEQEHLYRRKAKNIKVTEKLLCSVISYRKKSGSLLRRQNLFQVSI